MSRMAGLALSPLLSLTYRGGRGMALIYHEVFPPGGRRPHTSTQISLADFEAQIAFVASRCRVMEADAFVTGLVAGRLPPRACLVTFDDGYADNVEVALPVLERHGVPALFFISSGYVKSGRPYEADAVHDILRLAGPRERVELDLSPWNGPRLDVPYATDADRSASYFKVTRIFKDQIRYADRRAVIDHLAERFSVDPGALSWPAMMTPEQVRRLADAGMTIGSHSEWHVSLSAEGPDEFARQLRSSRETLAEMTGQAVRYFSYPFGDPQYCVPAWPLVRDADYDGAFMACGLPSRRADAPWLIDRHATTRGLPGLWASLLGIKPSQRRQRKAIAACKSATDDSALD